MVKYTYRYVLLSIVLMLIVSAILLIQNPFKKIEIVQGEALGVKKSSELETGIEIGSLAPNFILRDIEGKLVKLSDLRNKKAVVVNFWASWCPFCLEEMPDFEEVAQKYKNDIVILGINRGEKREIAIDYAKNQLAVEVTYPILLDSNEDVSNVYILRGMPVTYFIDKDGVITNRYFGKITLEIMEQDIEKIIRK